jgi:nucleoside-diphosphate-sugar epimerase
MSTQVYHDINNVDHVYHCAAIVSFSKKQRVKMQNINVKGTSNIVNACLDNKVKKLRFHKFCCCNWQKRK